MRLILWTGVALALAPSISFAQEDLRKDVANFEEIPVMRTSPDGGFVSGSTEIIAPADERAFIVDVGLEGATEAQSFRLILGFDPAVLGIPEVLPTPESAVRNRREGDRKIAFAFAESLLPETPRPELAWPRGLASILCDDIGRTRAVARIKFPILDLAAVTAAGRPPLSWSLSVSDRSEQVRPCVIAARYQGFSRRSHAGPVRTKTRR